MQYKMAFRNARLQHSQFPISFVKYPLENTECVDVRPGALITGGLWLSRCIFVTEEAVVA